MSIFEHVFIGTELAPAAAAGKIAVALGLEVTLDDEGRMFLGGPASAGRSGQVGGDLYRNRYGYPFDDPYEESVIDGYELVWNIGYTRPGGDVQLNEAWRLFEALASSRLWPILLVRGLDLLVAAWEPALGLRRFPAGTTPDVRHRALWQPYRRAA